MNISNSYISESKAESDYQPIEFFLSLIDDYKLVAWISDQVGCLRAVYKITEYESEIVKDSIKVGSTSVRVVRHDDNTFDIQSDEAINLTHYETKATCLFLKDGTVIIFMFQGNNLAGYHFCFESAPDEMFQAMIQKQ